MNITRHLLSVIAITGYMESSLFDGLVGIAPSTIPSGQRWSFVVLRPLVLTQHTRTTSI
jgi:hypothetical protein